MPTLRQQQRRGGNVQDLHLFEIRQRFFVRGAGIGERAWVPADLVEQSPADGLR